MKTHALMFGLSAGLALTTFSAQAALTHYVPFDAGYTPGALGGQGGSDLGFGANTWFNGENNHAVVGGNLTGPAGLPVAGDSASTAAGDGAGFGLAFYTFDQDNDGMNGEEADDSLTAGVHYISFLARAEDTVFFAGLSLVKFFGDEVLYIGSVDDGNGNRVWGVDTGGNVVVGGGDASVDTLLVARLTIVDGASNDTVELFINPTLGGMAPVTADLTATFNQDASANRGIDEIRLGSQNGGFFVDEIRIGTEFADVAPVPEPGSLALLGLGGLALLRRRR